MSIFMNSIETHINLKNEGKSGISLYATLNYCATKDRKNTDLGVDILF